MKKGTLKEMLRGMMGPIPRKKGRRLVPLALLLGRKVKKK